MTRNFRIAALAFLILLACSIARAHSDGIYNPTANNIGNFEGIDSNNPASGSSLACTYTPVTSGTQNVAYTGATPSASGGVPAYTFSETGSLPTGLSINTSTGVISGTPSVSGTFPGIQVQVADTVPTAVNCGASFTLVISAPSYTGPGDILTTNWKGWWGFRAFTSATRGTKLANICNSTGGIDVLCQDFSSDPVTGLLVVTTIGGVTCTTNCTVKTLYDQSGALACGSSVACDMTNATVASRPVLVPSLLSGDAGMSCNGSSQQLLTVGLTAQIVQPFSVTFVAERTSSPTLFNVVLNDDNGGTVQTGFNNSANHALFYSGTVVAVAGVNDSAWHASNVTYTGVSSIYNIDSATATISPGANSFGVATQAMTICATAGSNWLAGNFLEAGVRAASNTAGNLSSLNTNQHSAYGF